MKIKVLSILRGENLIANIGDLIEVDEKIGNGLIKAGAAELVVVEVVTETIQLIEEVEKVETVKEIESIEEVTKIDEPAQIEEIEESKELEEKSDKDLEPKKKTGRR